MTQPATSRSRTWIRWLDYSAMAALAAIVLYKAVLPHPTGELPPAGVTVLEAHGKPVMVDLSSTR